MARKTTEPAATVSQPAAQPTTQPPTDDVVRPVAVQVACALLTHPRYAGAQTERDIDYLATRSWAIARAVVTPH